MKKFALLAGLCGFLAMGCSDSVSVEDACEHMKECEMVESVDQCVKDGNDAKKLAKGCESEYDSVMSCQNGLSCDELKKETNCEKESAKLQACILKQAMGSLGSLF